MKNADRVEKLLSEVPALLLKFHTIHVTDDPNLKGTFRITMERAYDTSVTFELLDLLSVLFKTKKINVTGGERSTGYCESCAGSEAYVEAYVEVEIREAAI